MLHWAAAENNVNLCRQLIQFRADPLAQDDFGRTPLQCARDAGHPEVAHSLLELLPPSSAALSPSFHGPRGLAVEAADCPRSGCRATDDPLSELGGADLPPGLEQVVQRIDRCGWQNIRWAKGFTALHMAAKEDCARLCARFLAQGANPWAQDDLGRTAFDYAREFGSAGALAQLEGQAGRGTASQSGALPE